MKEAFQNYTYVLNGAAEDEDWFAVAMLIVFFPVALFFSWLFTK